MKILKIKYKDLNNGTINGIFVKVKDGFKKIIILDTVFNFKDIISESEIGEMEV